MTETQEKELEQQIKELKAKHGVIFKLEIPTDDGEEILLLRKLDRITYKAGSKILEKDEIEASEVFIRALTVGGTCDADKICKDFDALRTASSLLADIVAPKSGNVTKL